MKSFTVESDHRAIGHNVVNWDDAKGRLSQMLTDYQMREVIESETKDIKNILYIKAFANVEELLADEEV